MNIQTTESRIYFEAKIGNDVYPVLPGFHKVIQNPKLMLTTLLGSCVAACIRDRKSGTGGLNHFLLPAQRDAGQTANFSARYGVNAMEILINDILRRGARKSDLEVKVFGGSQILAGKDLPSVGQQNADFVLGYLKDEGLGLLASDLGGMRARRVFFMPSTGNVRVQYLSPSETAAQSREEVALEKTIRSKATTSPTVELF
ncbi:chemotaxis protein CheD [Halovulum sp. GXIMD14793]